MAQSSPSNILYEQIVKLITDFQQDYALNKYRSPQEITTAVKEIATKFNQAAGQPLTNFEPVTYGEPPSSFKMNRFWNNIQSDINTIEGQIDLLRAGAVSTHNFIKTEIEKANNENLRIQNKIKTLELYTTTNDPSLVVFSDFFITDDFIDWDVVDSTYKANLISQSNMVLGLSSESGGLLKAASVKILPTSNGFAGDNQEIQDPATAQTDPITNEKLYVFKAETNPANNLNFILDNQPTTWFEYEIYKVSDSDRSQAGNLNFVYYKPITDIQSVDYTNSTSTNGLVDWAVGPTDSILRLELEFDLGAIKTINSVTLNPFGLEDNSNNPMKISQVLISTDLSNWEAITPENVWVTSSLNRQNYTIADNITIGTVTWVLQNKSVRYIRFRIEQPNPISVNIGHLYYVPLSTSTTSTNPARVPGPIPAVTNPIQYYSVQNSVVNNLIQKREYFQGQRWVIGIRDIDIYSYTYTPKSYIISKRLNVAGIVDRVAIEADIEVPSTYDASDNWVKFYISPDDGVTWYQISRIQDDFLGIPEIISFNDPTPVNFRDPGVTNFDTTQAVNSVRLKVELSRPSDQPYTSPILKSYKLKIKRR
jgi:hypothetical protein